MPHTAEVWDQSTYTVREGLIKPEETVSVAFPHWRQDFSGWPVVKLSDGTILKATSNDIKTSAVDDLLAGRPHAKRDLAQYQLLPGNFIIDPNLATNHCSPHFSPRGVWHGSEVVSAQENYEQIRERASFLAAIAVPLCTMWEILDPVTQEKAYNFARAILDSCEYVVAALGEIGKPIKLENDFLHLAFWRDITTFPRIGSVRFADDGQLTGVFEDNFGIQGYSSFHGHSNVHREPEGVTERYFFLQGTTNTVIEDDRDQLETSTWEGPFDDGDGEYRKYPKALVRGDVEPMLRVDRPTGRLLVRPVTVAPGRRHFTIASEKTFDHRKTALLPEFLVVKSKATTP